MFPPNSLFSLLFLVFLLSNLFPLASHAATFSTTKPCRGPSSTNAAGSLGEW